MGVSLLIAGHQQLIAAIVSEMTRTGPITFARFMELALYHPQFGYYVRPVDPEDRAHRLVG